MSDNSDQAEFWSSDAGRTWVAEQTSMDAVLQPVLDGVLTRADLQAGQSVLDIGCGTGISSIEAAVRVGTSGLVLGADISPTMLESATARARDLSNVQFLKADAAAHTFEQGAFDCLISRFGVMFFSDPVGAFHNIALGLKPGARLTMATWGQIPNNPWFTLPAQAAKAVVGAPPAVDPDEPGPFAFRDAGRVCDLLRAAGLEEVAVEIAHIELTPPGTIAVAAAIATKVGPASRTFAYFESADADRQAVEKALRDAFKPYETADGVRIPAEINYFTARAPRS